MRHKIKKYQTPIIVLIITIFYIFLRYILIPNSNPEKLINDFLAGLFLSFGVLQINTFNSTKEALKKYDFFGKKFDLYNEIFPFAILFFGIALHINEIPVIVSFVAIALFGGQIYEMLKIVKSKKEIKYVSFGAKSSLPVSRLTIGINGLIVTLGLLLIILEVI